MPRNTKKSPSKNKKASRPIDTADLCEKILKQLRNDRIPQEVFAEKICKRSQGTVSTLLKKPAPWEQLKHGKDVYRRMKTWLDLPERKRKAAVKVVGLTQAQIKRKEKAANPTLRRRSACVFKPYQAETLRQIYIVQPHPSADLRQAIATQLSLDVSTITNFFANARRRIGEVSDDVKEQQLERERGYPQRQEQEQEQQLPQQPHNDEEDNQYDWAPEPNMEYGEDEEVGNAVGMNDPYLDGQFEQEQYEEAHYEQIHYE